MKQSAVDDISLSRFVDLLQGQGQYTFTKEQAFKRLGGTEAAFKLAALRLSKKKRIFSPRRGFFVIVPTEYQPSGAPPATWFIDDLMKFEEASYYVGLLSAAALYGAAHQQPQEFQIIADQPLRPIKMQRERLHFFTKKNAAETPHERYKTQTGHILVSTPEATALDLVRYQSSAGYLSNVATVLGELSEKMNPRVLLKALKDDGEMAIAQRLGFLLEMTRKKTLSEPIARWVASKDPMPTPLVPTRVIPRDSRRNERWRLILNEDVEVDR